MPTAPSPSPAATAAAALAYGPPCLSQKILQEISMTTALLCSPAHIKIVSYYNARRQVYKCSLVHSMSSKSRFFILSKQVAHVTGTECHEQNVMQSMQHQQENFSLGKADVPNVVITVMIVTPLPVHYSKYT